MPWLIALFVLAGLATGQVHVTYPCLVMIYRMLLLIGSSTMLGCKGIPCLDVECIFMVPEGPRLDVGRMHVTYPRLDACG